MSNSTELDSAGLPPDLVVRLKLLIDQAGIASAGETLTKQARDLKQHAIVIEEDDRRTVATFDDLTLTPDIRALIDLIEEHGA